MSAKRPESPPDGDPPLSDEEETIQQALEDFGLPEDVCDQIMRLVGKAFHAASAISEGEPRFTVEGVEIDRYHDAYLVRDRYLDMSHCGRREVARFGGQCEITRKQADDLAAGLNGPSRLPEDGPSAQEPPWGYP